MKARKSAHLKMMGTPIQIAVCTLLAGAQMAHAQVQKEADNALPEVTVTATKRATSLQKTPVAITVIGSSALDDAHVQTIQDAVSLVPSFSGTTQGDHGIISLTMRGVGNDSAKTEYADPEVAMFVDGVYAARPEGATALLFDMDSIEVLRGPQGTLWGRNATVGTVNIKTSKPILNDNSGSVEGGVGSFNRFGTRGAFNVSVSDTMALRFAYVHEEHDGYVSFQTPVQASLASQQSAYADSNGGSLTGFQPINYNLFVQGGPKYSAQNQSAARASLLWKLTPDMKLDLSYEKFMDRGTPQMSLMQTPRAGADFWSALIDTAPYMSRDTDTVRSRLEYQINRDMSLTYVGGYSHATGSATFDQDQGVRAPTSFTTGANFQEDRTNWLKYTSYSHELNLQSTGKKDVDWILGLYYGAEDNGIRFDIPIMNGTSQGTVSWQGSFIQPKETVQTSAIFGQATFNMGTDLHLTLGARYTADERENIGGRGHGWAYDASVPQIPISPGLDPSKPGSGFNDGCCNDAKYTNGKATYLGRVNYDLSNDHMVYASVATGYKSGGTGDGGEYYGPETLTNYEFGTKSSFAGGTIKLNTALYSSDFQGFQFSQAVQDANGVRSFKTKNADGAKVSGFEVELAAKLTPVDRIGVVFSTTNTKLGYLIGSSNDYALPTCPAGLGASNCLDVTGNELPHAPKAALQFQYSHTMNLAGGATLTPRISMHYESASWLSVFNGAGAGQPGSPTNDASGDKQDSYSRTDIGLRYVGAKNWYADFFIRNVEDARIKTSSGLDGSGAWLAQYMPPRTLGVNVGYEF